MNVVEPAAEPVAAAPDSAPGSRTASALRELLRVAELDLVESVRARWFLVYGIVFGGLVVLLFATAVTESRIMGFLGLSRFLVTYIEICMAVVPVFVLVTIVRSVAGDREAGVTEYLLSLPVSLRAWFWGRLLGRFVVVFLPAFLAMAASSLWAAARGIPVPWGVFALYTGMLATLCWCFLGIGMLLSAFARSVELAQGMAFLVWLGLILFLDIVLLGVMIQERLPAATVVAIALANPLQVFRTATMMLFDPNLVVLGPSAFVILDAFGRTGYLAWGFAYPLLLGLASAAGGFWRFRAGDLV